ncbi:MAG: DNA-binding response regulator [Flavobacteriales bacterium]|nr:DNA-binding response regulator [Flavobacteriales bacterium]
MVKKILIVDDEKDILEFLGYNLRKEGYEVIEAKTGDEALHLVKNNIPDLIILDVMMPGIDGIETCQSMREMPKLKDTLIIFLTARNEDFSQIAGLDAGADDYVSKPIKPKVLLSRIKAIFRRNQTQSDLESYGDVEINYDTKQLKFKGKEQSLTKKEYDLLLLLCSKPGKVFNREEILQSVWGGDVVVGNRTIDVHIKRLREKTSSDYIKTVKGFGYKFIF